MTSTGYGDLTATNEIERVFALMVMLAGLVLYGYILGSLAATIANVLLPR